MDAGKAREAIQQRDQQISLLRGETTKLQQEISRIMAISTEEKEKLRSEYLYVIERQKQEVNSLNSRLAATDKEGQDLDAKTRALSEENERLRQSLAQSEKQLTDQTGEMADQIRTYKVKLNEMLDQLEGKESQLQSKENMLKNKEDELVAHQTDIQKQREKMSQLD